MVSTLRHIPWKKVGVALAAVAVAACSTLFESRRPLQSHMAFHSNEIHLVRNAIIDGDLEAVREPARAIWLQSDHPDLPRGVDSPIHDVRRAAHRTAASRTLEEAAEATAEMGSACARCHRAADGGPTLEPQFPPTGTSVAARMLRHQWAADRMWDGLIGDDADVWMAGASALSDAQLVPEGWEYPELVELARQVHDLGAEGRKLWDINARAGVYGRLLTTCSSCHHAIRETETY
jgi:cytochrome c553